VDLFTSRFEAEVGVAPGEGKSTESGVGKRAVEPPEARVVVKIRNDAQPIGRLRGPIDCRERDSRGGLEHRDLRKVGRLPHAPIHVIEQGPETAGGG
jgi:hypothetical protein